MANPLMEKFLKANEGRWQEASEAVKEGKGGFDNKPDGRYVGKLAYAEIEESKGQGTLQIAWRATVLEGDYVGETIYWYAGLEGERSFEFVQKDLQRFGYEPGSYGLRQLPAILVELVKAAPVMRLRLRTKPSSDYQNVFIDKVFEDGEYEEDETDEEHNERVSASASKPAPAPVAPAPAPARGKTAAKPAPAPAPPPPAPAPARGKAGAKPAPAPAPPPPPAPEPEEDDEEDVELEIGMIVTFDRDGKTRSGAVTAIDEESETATVKVGIKSFKVAFEDLTVEENETDD